MKDVVYTVVENAGYVGECDIKTGFRHSVDAWKWVDNNYDEDEKEALRIDIRRDPEGTYDY